MAVISKVTVFGAAGNFGAPITAALRDAGGFEVVVFTRPGSTSIPLFTQGRQEDVVVRVDYADEKALEHEFRTRRIQAVVSVLGPKGVGVQKGIVDAAYAAGCVGRFIVNDFGWGFGERALPEFKAIGESRHVAWDQAMRYARRDDEDDKGDDGARVRFTWTGITIGNPIDWALAKFPHMGFDIPARRATIYDAGTEAFTGTTLAGIGQSVVGVLRNPAETANRFVQVRSIKTCQNELLAAFKKLTTEEDEWTITHSTAHQLLVDGCRKHAQGDGGWVLDLLVYQMYAPGEARCVVGSSDEEDGLADSRVLGIAQESAEEVVRKALDRV
ncbi:NmrA-like family protein [Xylariaceae sp. FL0594]|nr:NmrA-like family protein [Xylariaceae sp. FL0594]